MKTKVLNPWCGLKKKPRLQSADHPQHAAWFIAGLHPPIPIAPPSCWRSYFPTLLLKRGCRVQGHPAHTLHTALGDCTRRKATQAGPLTAASSERGRLLNSTTTKRYTGLNREFPNPRTDCTLMVSGAYKEPARALSKASFRARCNRSVRSDSQNHSREPPV